MGTQRRKKLPVGVRINKHKSGSSTLYIAFTFQGVECREPLSNRPVDDSNIEYAKNLRAEIKRKIKDNTFKYAEYFPNSEKIKIFGGATSKQTLKCYLDKFLLNAERRGCRPSTLATYRSHILSLIPYFGAIRPSNLSTSRIRDIFITMHNDGYSYDALTKFCKLLKSSLDEAVLEGDIEYNPTHAFKVSKYIAKPDDEESLVVNPFSAQELKSLLEACETKAEQLMLKFWVKTGLRTGEICGLLWENINVKRNYLEIRNNIVSQTRLIGPPKTKSSQREIDLDSETLEILKEMYEISGQKSEYVFPNPRGVKQAHHDSGTVRNWFTKICKIAGVEYRYAYHLRHTYATIQISQHKNLWEIAKSMGHKSPEMLFHHYGSFIKEYETKSSPFE